MRPANLDDVIAELKRKANDDRLHGLLRDAYLDAYQLLSELEVAGPISELRTLYERRINKRLIARICQPNVDGERAQFMALVLHDEQTGRWISLRLSTFRKVVRFVASKWGGVARPLTWFEKLRLDWLS